MSHITKQVSEGFWCVTHLTCDVLLSRSLILSLTSFISEVIL